MTTGVEVTGAAAHQTIMLMNDSAQLAARIEPVLTDHHTNRQQEGQ